MPAKKSKRVESLRLTPTGKMVILIDMENTKGPIEFRVDDVEFTLEVMQLVLDRVGSTFPVNSFTKKQEKQLAEYVKGE